MGAVEELVSKYTFLLKDAESGIMQSKKESLYGEIWCKEILQDLKELQNNRRRWWYLRQKFSLLSL